MLGEADRVVAEVVGELSLLAQLVQHAAVEVAAASRQALLDLAPAADGRQVEEGDLHQPLLSTKEGWRSREVPANVVRTPAVPGRVAQGNVMRLPIFALPERSVGVACR